MKSAKLKLKIKNYEKSFRFSLFSLHSGQSLVEILIAIGMAAIILPALLVGFVSSRDGRVQRQQRVDAVGFLNETVAAMRQYREAGWPAFIAVTPGAPYHPAVSGNTWTLATGAETVNGLTRQVVLNDACRYTSGANSGDIASCSTPGTTSDPSTKQAVTTVSWSQPGASSLQSTTYFTRFMDSLSTTQTTDTDFNTGNNQGTVVQNDFGGEVVLGAGNANWCRPSDYILSTYTLPRPGNAISAVAGPTVGSASSAYVGMGIGTTGPTFQKLSISAPVFPTPPVVSGVGSGYTSSFKTNAVFSDGTNFFLAVDGTTSQVVILNSSYTKIASINLPSLTNANGIYVASNVLYVTSGNKIYSYNVSNPAAPVAVSSATVWDSGATAKQVVVQSGKAFVSMSGSITGMEIFTVGATGTPFAAWSVASVNWFQDPKGLAVNSSGSRAYIAFGASGTIKGGFFIVNTASRVLGLFNQNLATYNTNWDGTGVMDPKGMAIASANKAIVVGTTSEGQETYQVVDITSDQTVHCGGLHIGLGVSGVSAIIQQDGRVFSYIISGETNDQFKVIEGGSGAFYTNSGTFESSSMPVPIPQYPSGFNRITATVDQPSQTNVQLQVAVAQDVSGSCSSASYTYVGPDGSPTSYFTPTSGVIYGVIPFGNYSPNYTNPGRCFRYKAILSTTDTNQTPVLKDVTVNYSP
jgi:type II secretory pathway pseudopilin PulG